MFKDKHKLYIHITLTGLVCLSCVFGISSRWNLANAEDTNNSQIEETDKETIIMDDYIIESKGYSTHSKEEHKKLMDKLIKKEMQSGTVYILSDDNTIYTLSGDGEVHALSGSE